MQSVFGDADAPIVVELAQKADLQGVPEAGRAFLDDPAVLDDDEAVGEHQRVERVVGDHEGRAGVPGEMPARLGAGVETGTGVQGGEGSSSRAEWVDGQRPG
jgi:hypothetical protein